MVFLNQIYTKSGDAGQTGLGDGSRVPKTHDRVVAYGTVDELNSVLGLVRTAELPEMIDEWLFRIQNDLFDIGADLCVPEAVDGQTPEHPPLRVSAAQVTWLEDRVDEVNEPLDPLLDPGRRQRLPNVALDPDPNVIHTPIAPKK